MGGFFGVFFCGCCFVLVFVCFFGGGGWFTMHYIINHQSVPHSFVNQ